MNDVRRLGRVGVCGGLLAMVAYLDACAREASESGGQAVADSAALDSAAATGLAAIADTGEQKPGSAGGPTPAGPGDGWIACNPRPDTNPGMRMPGRPETNADSTWEYVRNLCFSNRVGPGAPAQEGKHPDLGGNLLLMPENRMHRSHPDSLRPGHGMVAGVVLNRGPGDLNGPKHPPAANKAPWSAPLRAGERGFIWYGRDANGTRYSSLFVVSHAGGRPQISVIDTGIVHVFREGQHPESRARWHSPHDTVNLQPDITHPGSGWISCLSGCCTAGRVFSTT